MTLSDMNSLQRAFDQLAEHGILHRHNYWCCGGCASGGIATEYDELPAEDKARANGVVYYHEQQAENAINGHGLRLMHGSLPYEGDTSEADKVVAQKIVQSLRDNGLAVEWDGDISSVITISKFEVTLEEVPVGTGNTLHERADEEEDDDYWDDEDDEDADY